METAADRAATEVRALIATGKYGSGDRLPSERELAQELGLSRPALREGIRRLRSGGVLDSRRGSGTYVVEVDLKSVFDVRVRLEPFAAERAALLRDEQELLLLLGLAEQMAAQVDDFEAFAASDSQIHRLVAQASRSPVLTGTLNRLTEMMSLSHAVTAPKRAVRTATLRDMQSLVTAIERKHPRRAANAMQRHLTAVRASLDGAAS